MKVYFRNRTGYWPISLSVSNKTNDYLTVVDINEQCRATYLRKYACKNLSSEKDYFFN